MHPTIQALLELDDIDRQRRILTTEREGKESRVAEARQAHERALAALATLQEEAGSSDALMRQYQDDISSNEERIAALREQQMSAKTNKEYMAAINGIEEAKSRKTMSTERLADLEKQVAEQQGTVAAAAAEVASLAETLAKVELSNTTAADAESSESELDRLYKAQREQVDAKFLEVYERLVRSRHKMPVMPIDPRTRATPYGSIISHNQMEQIRGGALALDSTTNAILYIKEEPPPRDE